MSDDDKNAEARGYSRGYAAGRRRVAADDERDVRRMRDEDRRDRFFCAALNGLLPHAEWTMGDKPLKSMKDYVELAARLADESMKNLRCRSAP